MARGLGPARHRLRRLHPDHASRAITWRSRAILAAVYENGRDDIYLGHYEGLYCVACEAYYTEDDLLPGEPCPIHERPVEFFREDNYFFRLSRLRGPTARRTTSVHPAAVEPETRRNEVLSVIRGALRDFSISRTTFDWGVPLPWDPDHVCYVWFDALTNYITAAGYADDPQRFARVVAGRTSTSIGKDILRFHAIYWPAMLMAAGLEPPTQVWAHGYLTVGGKKMSKTNLTGIHPFELIDHFGDGLLPLLLHARDALRRGRQLQLGVDDRPPQRGPGERPGEPRQPRARDARYLVRRGGARALGRRARRRTCPR